MRLNVPWPLALVLKGLLAALITYSIARSQLFAIDGFWNTVKLTFVIVLAWMVGDMAIGRFRTRHGRTNSINGSSR